MAKKKRGKGNRRAPRKETGLAARGRGWVAQGKRLAGHGKRLVGQGKKLAAQGQQLYHAGRRGMKRARGLGLNPLFLLGAGAIVFAVGVGYYYARPHRVSGRKQVYKLKGPVGRHFTWEELTGSSTAAEYGLDNTPGPAARNNLSRLVAFVLDPLRDALGRAITINSGYRAPKVNARVHGSADDSDHMRGEAVDMQVDGMDAVALARYIVSLGLPFDQLIWYDKGRGGHVHIAFSSTGPNRREMLHAPAGTTHYTAWVP